MTSPSGNEKLYGDFLDRDMTDVTMFHMAVPEGMPTDKLLVRTEDGSEVFWEICTISGRIPQTGLFLTK